MTTPIDRPIFLTAAWRYLLMLNWSVHPELLEPLVPKGTTLAFHEQRTFISVVGFLFDDVRVMGLPVPGHTRFPEINLRFYVTHDTGSEKRHGVVFIREIAPRQMVALLANTIYNERYRALPMRDTIDLESGEITYEFEYRDRWQGISARIDSPLQTMAVGSHEEFISHQLWGYTARTDGKTNEFHVKHPVWKYWNVSNAKVDIDVEPLYGPQFVEPLSRPPYSAFLCDGSEIAVHRHSILEVA